MSMKWPGASRPRSGCCQRTSASMPAGRPVRHVDARLVVQHELLQVDRGAQLELEVQARLGRRRRRARRTARSRRGPPPWRGTSRCRHGAAASRRRCRPAGTPRCRPTPSRGAGCRCAAPPARAARRGCARRSRPACEASRTSCSSRHISSPPMRATRSRPRTTCFMRLASSCSRWSPAAWPSVSLMTLKRSTSTKITANWLVSRVLLLQRLADRELERGAVRQRRQLVVLGEEQRAALGEPSRR